MKRILIKLIKWYQKIPGNFHNNCKFIPTCSNYAIEAISEYGSIKGSLLTLKRILKCNPFSKGGIDLVPKRSLEK
ncbi:MAG: membrane protein insertion efficiency factor YidD [Firmicutes bacterium]|nr:membrane protein insertion efficiency factor YidD [Bacillota bacterium]